MSFGNGPWTEPELAVVARYVAGEIGMDEARTLLPIRSEKGIYKRAKRMIGMNDKVGTVILDPDDPGVPSPEYRIDCERTIRASARLLAAIQRAYPQGVPA